MMLVWCSYMAPPPPPPFDPYGAYPVPPVPMPAPAPVPAPSSYVPVQVICNYIYAVITCLKGVSCFGSCFPISYLVLCVIVL